MVEFPVAVERLSSASRLRATLFGGNEFYALSGAYASVVAPRLAVSVSACARYHSTGLFFRMLNASVASLPKGTLPDGIFGRIFCEFFFESLNVL